MVNMMTEALKTTTLIYFMSRTALAVNWAIYARNKSLDQKRRLAKAHA